jgi:hypothetical protein
MSPLEREYRGLLITYPRQYRREYEAEMVATLLDGASKGQSHPSAREAVALLVGGLRIRAQAVARLGPGTVWADGMRIGALLLLCSLVGMTLSDATRGSFIYSGPNCARIGVQCPLQPGYLLLPFWLAVAAIAVVRGSTHAALAIVLTAVTFNRWYFFISAHPPVRMILATGWVRYLLLSLGVVALVLACYPAIRRARCPWSWWLAPIVVAYAVLYAHLQSSWGGSGPLWLVQMAAPAVVLSAISLLANDARMSIGAAAYVGVHLLSGALSLTEGWDVAPMVVPAALVAIAGAGAIVSHRRLARER